MRYVGGIYVADDPRIWTWAVEAIQEHVLAAEERPLGRWVKRGVFRWLRKPVVRRCLPLRSVAATSPPMLGWDERRLLAHEQYIPGRPVQVHDLEEGMAVWSELWPLLAGVFTSRTAVKPLRLPHWVRQPYVRAWLYRSGLDDIFDEICETPVLHGLVHGDLQHSNMLVSKERAYIIDWGDHFHLGPPLYDLLFYLFKHARSVGTHRVVDAALADPAWIEEGLPGALAPDAVKASLVAFTLLLVRRYQFRNLRRRRTLVKHLQSFVSAAAERLLLSSGPFSRLPTVLLLGPHLAADATDGSRRLGA